MVSHLLERAPRRAPCAWAGNARGVVTIAVVLVLGACSGDSARAPADARGADARGADSAGVATPARTEAPSAAGSPRVASAALIAKGDSIFHGLAAGGTCQACHGPGGKGGTLAPDLTDAIWLHGDGSVAFLERIVTSGVATPKKYPAPMPPMGGAALSPSDVQAVAAYVSALRGAQPQP